MLVSINRERLLRTVIADKYHLTQPLGEGAFGLVYEAKEVLGQEYIGRVAVKLIAANDDDTRTKLMREIQALARLNHPNILVYRTSGVIADEMLNGVFYIITELAQTSLDKLKGREGRVPEDELRNVATGIAEALGYIHSQGAVHRDVKPANILQVGGHWKLADFGLVRAVQGSLVQASDYKGGTPGYLAPEALRNKEIGPATDVYALGATLLECLTGRLAHEGNSLEQFIANVMTKPANIPADLQEPWKTVITCCLEQDPSQRCRAAQISQLLLASSQPAASSQAAGMEPKEPAAETPVRNYQHNPATSGDALIPGSEETGHRRRHKVVVGALLTVALVAAVAVTLSPNTFLFPLSPMTTQKSLEEGKKQEELERQQALQEEERRRREEEIRQQAALAIEEEKRKRLEAEKALEEQERQQLNQAA